MMVETSGGRRKMTLKTLFFVLPLMLGACAADIAPPAAPAQSAAMAPADAAKLRQAGKEVLFWNQAQRDLNFRTMEKIFPTRTVKAGGKPRPLPAGEPIAAALGGSVGVEALMASMNASGLLVLQDGKVRLERYARGHGPSERWTSFSVAKSLTSTLVGAALQDGSIKSLDDPVTRYIPELAGSAYDGVTVRQILTMTSGVRWNEDYTDPKSDVAMMFSEAPKPGEDVTVAYLRKLPREAEPGTKWVYKTGETNLIGVLVRRATGKPLAEYASEKIWRPYGMEADAYWQIDEGGQEIGGCCLSVALRDYGRIGQFVLDGGKAGGRQVVPATWFAQATRAQADIGAPGRGYGYQWWTGPGGTFAGVGIFGQMIHVDPARRLVIVVSGAAAQATGRELTQARMTLVEKVTAAVR
jgi:CubicO group peptidase (beta-lactamase class C family)